MDQNRFLHPLYNTATDGLTALLDPILKILHNDPQENTHTARRPDQNGR